MYWIQSALKMPAAAPVSGVGRWCGKMLLLESMRILYLFIASFMQLMILSGPSRPTTGINETGDDAMVKICVRSDERNLGFATR